MKAQIALHSLFISVAAIPLFFSGCRTLYPPVQDNAHHEVEWYVSHTISWFSEKGERYSHLQGWARVSMIRRGEQSTFDAFLALNNNGEGRIEGLGPWKAPLFHLVFNSTCVYLYSIDESRLYVMQNNPRHIQSLFMLPFDFHHLFDSLILNLPDNLTPCSPPCLGHKDCIYLCSDSPDMHVKARVLITALPVAEEVWWGFDDTDGFRVRYGDMVEIEGYTFPKDIRFFWPQGEECRIRFNSLKVNQPVSQDMFLPEEAWFRGDVVHIDDTDGRGDLAPHD